MVGDYAGIANHEVFHVPRHHVFIHHGILFGRSRAASTLRMKCTRSRHKQTHLLLEYRIGVIGVRETAVSPHLLVDVGNLPEGQDEIVQGFVFQQTVLSGDRIADNGISTGASHKALHIGLHFEDEGTGAALELSHDIFVGATEGTDLIGGSDPRSCGRETRAGMNHGIAGIAVIFHGVVEDIPLVATVHAPIVAGQQNVHR